MVSMRNPNNKQTIRAIVSGVPNRKPHRNEKHSESPLLFAAVIDEDPADAEGEGRDLALRRRHQRRDVERHQAHREAAVVAVAARRRRVSPAMATSLGHALLVGGSTQQVALALRRGEERTNARPWTGHYHYITTN